MDQMKHGDEMAMSNGTHMQQMHQVQHPIPMFNAGPSKHSGMQYTCNTSAFDHSSSMWLDQNPNQVAFAPGSYIPQLHQVQHPVPRVLPQTSFNNSGPSARSERPHAYPSNMLLAQIPNNGIPPVSDYPYNTLLVQNMDGGMIQSMHNGMNPTAYLVPANLPEPGCAICGRSPMENAYGDPFNTLLDHNPNVGIMQGMNNGMIPVNNNTTSLGNSGHQIGNSGVRLQAPFHQLSIPSPPPFRNEPYSPGDQHSSNA
nr:hypothetical protein [Tanacetum cinerariifolium]